MTNYYVKKSNVGRIEKVQGDGFLFTQHGDIPVKEGSSIFIPLKGDPQILLDDCFENEYVQVEVKRSLEEQFAQGYLEMAKINLEEAESYRYTYGDGLEDL